MLDPKKISVCLITKDAEYPKEIWDHIAQFDFDEVLVKTMSDSPYRKHELFARAKNDLIFYQDDDAICPIGELLEQSDPTTINVAMKEGHHSAYKDNRATMGLGWGAIFPKKVLEVLKTYTDVYGEDDVFKRETERILTYLSFPQNRLILPIQDLPSAWGDDRLWRQPDHQRFRFMAEERCKDLIKM